MRKPTPLVSASQPTTTPPNQHTHEVIIRNAGATVIMKCYELASAERYARWEQRNGVEVEIVEVGR